MRTLLNEVHRLIEERGLRFLLTASSARKLRRGGVNLLGSRARTCYLHALTWLELGRVIDSERCEVVVSGSSARMLSREVHTSLRGRGMATVIRPFSVREFLRHRGEEPAKESRRWTAAERSLVEKRFRELLSEGGFPEAQGLAPTLRIELLQGYVDTVLFRDVIERYGISQVAALRWLVRHCLRSPGGSLSVHRLHQDLEAQGHGACSASKLPMTRLPVGVRNSAALPPRRSAPIGMVATQLASAGKSVPKLVHSRSEAPQAVAGSLLPIGWRP